MSLIKRFMQLMQTYCRFGIGRVEVFRFYKSYIRALGNRWYYISIGTKKSKRKTFRRGKDAIKSENLLLGAARNVVKDLEQQKLLIGEAFNIKKA